MSFFSSPIHSSAQVLTSALLSAPLHRQSASNHYMFCTNKPHQKSPSSNFKLQTSKPREPENKTIKSPHIHHASQSRFRLDFGLDPEILGQCRLPQRPACRLLPSGLPYQQLQSAGQQCHCGVSYFSGL